MNSPSVQCSIQTSDGLFCNKILGDSDYRSTRDVPILLNSSVLRIRIHIIFLLQRTTRYYTVLPTCFPSREQVWV